MTVNNATTLLEQVKISDEMTRQRVVIATELVEDITRLDSQMRASKKRIRVAVAASGTTLCDIRGIGPIGAAIILGSVGDIARFPTPGHFASYNATAPIEASSGDKRRHRLNPRGNANSIMPSTSRQFPSSATPEKAATTTRRRSPRARPPRKRSGR